MSDEYEKFLAEQRRLHPELFDEDGDWRAEGNGVPDEQAELIEVAGGLAWLRFRSRKTGELNERAYLGEENPQPTDEVRAWAKTWNKNAIAKWPETWILAPKTMPLKAWIATDLLLRRTGETVWTPVGGDLFRSLGPKADLIEQLQALPREAAATAELGGGYRFMITGIDQNVMASREDGLATIGPYGRAEDLSVRLLGRILEEGEVVTPRGLPAG